MIHEKVFVAASEVPHRSLVSKARRDRLVLFLLALAYATVRYQVGKSVPWSDWPVYTVNKALGLAALGLLGLGLLRRQPDSRAVSGEHFALAGQGMMAHTVLSLALLQPAYFPKFYEAGKLTGAAGIALLLGATSFLLFRAGGKDRAAPSFRSPQNRAVLGGAIAFVSGIHAALPGLGTWFAFDTWPLGLPPITLIAFVIGALALGICLRTRI